MSKNFLPISIDISNQKILIIGGGQSAFKKIKILQLFNADVEVIALKVCDEIKKLGIRYFEKKYNKNDLKDYIMLYSCTNNPGINKQIVIDGKEMGVLINVHDQPELCQFVSPAIFKHGNLTVAVGSNGKDVFKSIRVRNIIQEFLTKEYFKN